MRLRPDLIAQAMWQTIVAHTSVTATPVHVGGGASGKARRRKSAKAQRAARRVNYWSHR